MPPTAQPLIDLVRRVLAEHRVRGWLVGGIVRDALLGRDTRDLDVIVEFDSHTVAEWILAAAREGAVLEHTGFACLDKDWGCYRVVVGDATIDVVPLEGTLEDELLRRDLTVNALARPVEADAANVIDVAGGAADLANGVARAVRKQNLADDPVRLLRVARFAVELGLAIEKETGEWIRELAPMLHSVPGERVARELFAALESAGASRLPALLEDLGLLSVLLPELTPLRGIGRFGYHHVDAYDHSLEAYAFMARALEGEATLPGIAPELWARMVEAVSREPLAGVRSRRAMVLLAALLHDLGKPSCMIREDGGRVRFLGHERVGAEMAQNVAARLRLSRLETAHLLALVRHHMRPCMLGAAEEPPTPRACARVYRVLVDRTPDVCLLALGDRAASRGPAATPEVALRQEQAVARVLEFWQAAREREPKRAPLLTGRDLMTHLGIPQGPLIGRILRELRVAEEAGEVRDREAALALARGLLRDAGADGRDGSDR